MFCEWLFFAINKDKKKQIFFQATAIALGVLILLGVLVSATVNIRRKRKLRRVKQNWPKVVARYVWFYLKFYKKNSGTTVNVQAQSNLERTIRKIFYSIVGLQVADVRSNASVFSGILCGAGLTLCVSLCFLGSHNVPADVLKVFFRLLLIFINIYCFSENHHFPSIPMEENRLYVEKEIEVNRFVLNKIL